MLYHEGAEAQTPPRVLECTAVIIGGIAGFLTGAGRRGPAVPARVCWREVEAGEGPAGGRGLRGFFAFSGGGRG